MTIASTLAGGGSATTTSYLWCGSDICQARNASNATIKGYYDEGEFVPGTPGQPYYYSIDQIGSVRRAFASTSSAPAYGYDPYGAPLQTTAPVTDFVYGGIFYNADSGIYLTNSRVYDPIAGRWLSRDPLGESTDRSGNLYPYVGGNPVNVADPLGTNPLAGAFAGGAAGSAVLPGVGTIVGAAVGAVAVTVITYIAAQQLKNIIYAKPPNESRPVDAPTGTRPINGVGLGRPDIHDIKEGIQAEPNDWVGIAPNGDVITSHPEAGTAVNHGPADDYTRRPTGLCEDQ